MHEELAPEEENISISNFQKKVIQDILAAFKNFTSFENFTANSAGFSKNVGPDQSCIGFSLFLGGYLATRLRPCFQLAKQNYRFNFSLWP